MEKTVIVDGKEVKLKATAATPRLYRLKFRRDLMVDLSNLSKAARKTQKDVIDLEIFENVAYIMNKQADPSVPDDINEWLDRFSTFAMNEVLPTILELWGANMETLVESKKNMMKLAEK